MKRYRKGKDLQIRWPILTNGENKSLVNRDITIILIDPHGNNRKVDFTILDSVVQIIYRGTEQKYTGKYTLTLWENFRKENQSAVDKCEAFELVEFTCQEGGADNNIETEEILHLEASLLQTGMPGLSAYEVAVKNGFSGSEEEWLQSLIGPQGEAFKFSDFTPEQIEVLQEPAKATITELNKTNNSVKQAETARVLAEQQREKNETQRNTNFTELSQSLSTAINKAEEAANKATEAAANIPVNLQTIKETTDINI